MRLKDKVAIITGAGAGIGKATAELFCKEGVKVCCNSITESASEVVKGIKKNNGEVVFCQGDVSKENDCLNIVNFTLDKYGQIDILFNNAGIVIPGTNGDTSIEDWDQTMTTNVRSVFLMSKFSLPYLKETKGCIINTSSSVALKGVKDRFSYTASKGAILSMTRSMAMDYIDFGIRVNCICPGTVESPSLTRRLSKFEDPDLVRKQFIARQPLGRFGKAEEIAEGVLYLACAEFCTGTSLSIDGGMTI